MDTFPSSFLDFQEREGSAWTIRQISGRCARATAKKFQGQETTSKRHWVFSYEWRFVRKKSWSVYIQHDRDEYKNIFENEKGQVQ